MKFIPATVFFNDKNPEQIFVPESFISHLTLVDPSNPKGLFKVHFLPNTYYGYGNIKVIEATLMDVETLT